MLEASKRGAFVSGPIYATLNLRPRLVSRLGGDGMFIEVLHGEVFAPMACRSSQKVRIRTNSHGRNSRSDC